MRAAASDPAEYRDFERARISRWIRDSECGWMFLGKAGEAYHIFEDEAVRLEAQGNALLEEHLAAMPRMQRWGKRATAATFFMLAMFIVLAIAVKSSAIPSWLPYTFPAPALAYLAATVLMEVRYRRRLAHWRTTISTALKSAGRTSPPAEVATYHHRYNLFLILNRAAAIPLLALICAGHLLEAEGLAKPSTILFTIIALLVIVIITAWPASRITQTHLRRKWFD